MRHELGGNLADPARASLRVFRERLAGFYCLFYDLRRQAPKWVLLTPIVVSLATIASIFFIAALTGRDEI